MVFADLKLNLLPGLWVNRRKVVVRTVPQRILRQHPVTRLNVDNWPRQQLTLRFDMFYGRLSR